MIQRDINQRRITDISSAKAAIALKQSKIKELRQYTTRVPVNVRSQSNPYRTFNIPYTATAKIKPKARRPKPQRPTPRKSSVQAKVMAQRNRLQQSRQAPAPRRSISKLKKPKSKLVPANRMRMMRRLRQQRAKKRFRARRAMGPTRSKGNRRAKRIDKSMSRPTPRRTQFRRNTRANRALSKDRTSAQSKTMSDRKKAFIAQQKRLRANQLRRQKEKQSVRGQSKLRAQRATRKLRSNRAVKAASKSKIARRLTKVRASKASVAKRKKQTKKRVSKLRKRFRFGQANLGSIRRNEGLGQAMVALQHELAQAQHEDNQLAALFGQLAKEEASLVQQLYAEEEDFAGTAPRHQRISREPQSSSGRSFYDNREFNTYASRLASNSEGIPTPAYKELVRTYNNNITNGQFKSVRQALQSFTQQIASKRGEYFTRVVTPKQQAQARQLGMLTVQKNRRAKSTPDVRTITARQRALYEQQRVAEDARSEAASKSAKVEQQLAGVFPRTRSAMERMTR
ncbi:hypothetical protein N9N26_00855 [Candidatus Poseidoniales archaeon]|nr:hypothetical protein [Candidatus Poseidoniales archaeon]